MTSPVVPNPQNPAALSWHEARSMTPMQRVEHYTVGNEQGCLLWTGAVANQYGAVQVEGKTRHVHRWVWEQEHCPYDTK